MRKITTCILALLGCISFNVSGQDVHFSQFYESPLTLNPALGGCFNGQVMGELNYRSQWASVMGPTAGFNTMEATFELHNITKKWAHGYLSPGLYVYNDKSGDASVGITEVALNLASGVFLSERSTLSAGLQGGWSQHSINLAGLSWDNQYINGAYDANAPTGETSVGNTFSYVDFSAGMAYSYVKNYSTITANDQFKFNIGAAVYHVNQPNMSYYGQDYDGTKLYMRYVLHADLEYGVTNSNIALVPGFAFYQQGPAQETDIGMKIRYILRQESKYTGFSKGSALDIGGYYRAGDAFYMLLQLELGGYSLGFSYDFNTSDLTTASSGRGGFELSLRFINPNPFLTSSTGDRSMF